MGRVLIFGSYAASGTVVVRPSGKMGRAQTRQAVRATPAERRRPAGLVGSLPLTSAFSRHPGGRAQGAGEDAGDKLAGHKEALAAHQAVAAVRRVDPAIAQAVERQARAMRELSRRAFPEPEALSDDQLAPPTSSSPSTEKMPTREIHPAPARPTSSSPTTATAPPRPSPSPSRATTPVSSTWRRPDALSVGSHFVCPFLIDGGICLAPRAAR